jgi:hypothetical protein
MKEIQKYKAIRKILQKVSLNRRDSDWEKMNRLLNIHLPVKAPSVNPFHSVKLLAYGGSVVLVTAVTAMIHQGFHHSKKHKPETIISKSTVQSIDSLHSILLPGIETATAQKLSSDSIYAEKRENIHLSDSKAMVASGVNDSRIIERKSTHPDSNRQPRLRQVFGGAKPSIVNPGFAKASARRNRQPSTANPGFAKASARRNRQPSSANPASAKNSAGRSRQPSTANRQPSAVIDHQSTIKTKSAHDLTIFLSQQEIARLTSEKEKHSNWISRNTSNKKNQSGGMKLSNGKNVANKKLDEGSYFRFGIGLPLVQYYSSNPDQTFQLNYIPGLTGQYVINNHWAFGMNIFPYQKILFSDRDSIYTSFGRDSSISPNNSYIKKYYLNNLNAWAAEINLDYRINGHMGIEGGFGLQGIWNAKGYVTTLSSDTLYNQPNQPFPGNHTSTQNIDYTRSDQQLSNLEKINFYYYLNLIYQSEKWSVSLGYNQNGKPWIPFAQGRSPGWIKLQFNYFFSTGKK